MTEDFIEIVKEDFPSWSKRQEQKIIKKNQEIKEENDRIQKIHELLSDEKVKEFAEYIGYKEKQTIKYLVINNSLYDFLLNNMTLIDWPDYILKKDKYPIYCFYKSQKPMTSIVTGKRLCDYTDLYINLQKPGYSFGPSDKYSKGNNRDKFRIENINNIIYPLEGESFADEKTFHRVQAEFVEEALRTNQEQAKKLILNKYRRR